MVTIRQLQLDGTEVELREGKCRRICHMDVLLPPLEAGLIYFLESIKNPLSLLGKITISKSTLVIRKGSQKSLMSDLLFIWLTWI